MTTVPVTKKQLFKAFLAFYFLFFSVSPLTYAPSGKQVSENACVVERNPTSITSASLLPVASFAERESTPEEAPLADRKTGVLIKKKNAVAPEDSSHRISHCAAVSAPGNDFGKPLSLIARCFPRDTRGINKGFNPLFAGNSPPAV